VRQVVYLPELHFRYFPTQVIFFCSKTVFISHSKATKSLID